jgi:hypothetical protein
VLGESAAQAWREQKRSGERCGETQGWCSPFIGGLGLLGAEMLVSNGRRFTADAIDGRQGGGVLTGIQEGESRRGSKEL